MAFLEYRPSQTLYQYCSRDGFFGIIKSKRLWFSDLASANDPREITLGRESFLNALESVRDDEYRGEKGSLLSELTRHLAAYCERAQAFCSCFSLADDELPMWGAYGENYSGLAIGFRPTSICDIPARVQKVKYVNQNTHGEFRRLALEMAGQLEATGGLKDLKCSISLTVAAFAAMTSLKHSTWAYEREVRVVHVQSKTSPEEGSNSIFHYTGVLPDDKPVRWSKALGRTSPIGNVSFLEFSYGRYRRNAFDARRAIGRVLIGPNCTLSRAEVVAAMRDNGFEGFEVGHSDCKIR
jgi:hypothetical protein